MDLSLTRSISYHHRSLPVSFPCLYTRETSEILKQKHFHDCMELSFCKCGTGILTAEGCSMPFKQGDYFFFPEHTGHSLLPSADCSCLWESIYFDPRLLLQNLLPGQLLEQLLGSLSLCPVLTVREDEHELLFLMNRFFIELQKKEPFYHDSLRGLLLSLLMLLARQAKNTSVRTSASSEAGWLYSALHYIRLNYRRKLFIADIARDCCGLSESHFRRKFTQIMHISPLDYINQLRIRLACQMLYDNEKPIGEIAADAGFTTLSGFHRNFHAVLNCSPSDWQKQCLDEQSSKAAQAL